MEDYDDIDRILNELDNSPLNDEFGDAYDDPDDFDFGFEEVRADDGLANFDFDPEEARRMRMEQIKADEARVNLEKEIEELDLDFEEVEDDGYSY